MTAKMASSTALAALFAASLVSACGQSADATAAQSSSPSASNEQAGRGSAVRPSAPLDTGNVPRLVDDYKSACGNEPKVSERCRILRSLLVAELSTALGIIERSADQRGAARALAALDAPTEPQIVVPALRILGKFPTTPGIAAKVLPQLGNRYIEIQRMSAMVLTAIPDAGPVDVGQLWLRNHSELTTETLFDEYPDFPAHYQKIGFPKYPGASWFSPGDSDRSVGWTSGDDAAKVAQWFSAALKTEPLDAEQWSQRISERVMQTAGGDLDQAATDRMRQLVERALKGDETAKAELEKLQAEMAKRAEASAVVFEKGVDKITPPDSAATEARWIVAKKNGSEITAAVLVYPFPAIQRTVIQLAWDLGAYPSAWPPAAK